MHYSILLLIQRYIFTTTGIWWRHPDCSSYRSNTGHTSCYYHSHWHRCHCQVIRIHTLFASYCSSMKNFGQYFLSLHWYRRRCSHQAGDQQSSRPKDVTNATGDVNVYEKLNFANNHIWQYRKIMPLCFFYIYQNMLNCHDLLLN